MLSEKEIVCPNNLLNVAHKKKGVTVGIVNAGKPLPMLSVMDAVNKNLIIPVLIGDKKEIEKCASDLKFDISKYEIIHEPVENKTAKVAAKLASENKIRIIHPGCDYPIKISSDTSKIAKDIFQNSSPRLITIARLDPRKGHQNILMTIKNLLPKFPKLKYISIGDGSEKKNLEKLKEELGLNDHVKFIFQADEQNKLALLENSDLFIMPSIIFKKSVEGFGMTFIEAAAYKKASIGGIFGGENDAIINGKTGFLCDGNDLNSLYDTLLKCFENDLYKTLGANAFDFSKNFKWNKIVKQYIQLI